MNQSASRKEFSPEQEALHDACLTMPTAYMVGENNEFGRPELIVYSSVDARDTQAALRASSLRDLMLCDGAALSVDNPDGRAGRKKSTDVEERLRAQLLGDTNDTQEELEDEFFTDDANRIGMPDLKLHVGETMLTACGVTISQRQSCFGHP